MTEPTRPRPVVLIVLDGFGERAEEEDNAVRLARGPTLARLYSRYARTTLEASGAAAGLPVGQMGNSEVGHMILGAGRIAKMDITRIDDAVSSGAFFDNAELRGAIESASASGGALHLLGLVSPGGVHSSMGHLFALVEMARRAGVPVRVHAILDGRDTPPRSAAAFIDELEGKLAGAGSIALLCGRYWAMDRDNRWDRVLRAYDAIVDAQAPRLPAARAALEDAHAAGENDEFVSPRIVGDYAGMRDGDAAVFFNFRADRAREISRALATSPFSSFERKRVVRFSRYVCMTLYDASLGLPVAFPKPTLKRIFAEVLAEQGLTQLRCAETEKYAHVTYFFNGGEETVFPGEDRVLCASPKEVATYDQKPEMSAPAVTQAVVGRIETGKYDFVLVNFANPDMVGHTGMLEPAIAAVRAVDAGVGQIVDATLSRGGALVITADHGNCETMRDPATGQPHTAHTTNPVPLILVDETRLGASLRPGGMLCDVAPTLLEMMKLPQPPEMTGRSLLGS
ncbi:MAG: 2,3-bisphosphoglycerate-independent phosphoglycerate mutase [Deltaproteobacteria bacterium]|nr:2,3-bisphosphoglycerate-independent phosphoglycerate mutase [Deltaproteobacteria bacterium]